MLDQVFNKFRGTGKQDLTEDDLIKIHHIFMKEYGWIPLDQYQRLPSSTIINLLDCIQNDYKEINKKKPKRR
jgi:hypothetical protein